MFSEILTRYDALISKLNDFSIQESIETFLAINCERKERQKELSKKSEHDAYKRAQQLVKEFLAYGDDSDFFAKLEEIRSNTLSEYAEKFNNTCKQWEAILDTKEEQFVLLLKERMAQKPILFGNLCNKQLEWFVIGVDLFQQSVKLFLNGPINAMVFEVDGYTVIENSDSVLDCSELACGWKDSDVRKYLNTDFYHQVFSDEEKHLVLKTRRHINKEDFLIPNDISEDYVYLLDLDEFLMLSAEIQSCETTIEGEFYWLAEQKSRGWDDTGELPQIYVVECNTGKLSNRPSNNRGLVRPGIMISLDYFRENI